MRVERMTIFVLPDVIRGMELYLRRREIGIGKVMQIN